MDSFSPCTQAEIITRKPLVQLDVRFCDDLEDRSCVEGVIHVAEWASIDCRSSATIDCETRLGLDLSALKI